VHGVAEMGLIQHARMEAPLPQMAAPPMKLVDLLAVAEMGPPDGLRQGLLHLGHRDNVDVVGHEAITVNMEAIAQRMFTKKTSCWLFPRWVIWCASPATTIRATLGIETA